MKDLHIHIERGEYTTQWIQKFVDKAVEMGLDEINLLEHSIRIKEFHPTFEQARCYNLYQKKWFDGKQRQAHSMAEYKALIDEVRAGEYPVKICFGLEICWFEQHENYIRNLVDDGYFDYLLGSVHWIDNWTFNQRKYQWLGRDTDKIYKRYYEMNCSMIKSGIFDIAAHPDLIMCHGIKPSYDLREDYHMLAQTATEQGVMLEMNTSRGPGLNKELLEIAMAEGVSFSAGSDAHRPEDVGRGIKEVDRILSIR